MINKKLSVKRTPAIIILFFFVVGAFFTYNSYMLKKVFAQKLSPETISDELLVKFDKSVKDSLKEGNPKDTGSVSLNATLADLKVNSFTKVAKVGKNSKTDEELFQWYKITTDSDLGTLEAELKKLPFVKTVEKNYVVRAFFTPNDPYYLSSGTWGQAYPDLWGIKKINPEPAWDQTHGSASIIVADIDTGIDRNHVDLKNNIWVNSREILGNKIDDDGNGYIDDYYGWDFVNNDSDPMDDHGHGTHTSGTIAAMGNNNLGVIGVSFGSKIMALKFLSASGSGSSDNGAKAMQYAADNGAKITSNSWGCFGCKSQLLDDAVKYAHDRGVTTVVAAGNNYADDALNGTPASSEWAVTVGATDYQDQIAGFSNIGEKIDVVAPGVDILSTRASVNPMCTADKTVGSIYCRVSGTSMATPHVAGLAALLLSKNPALTPEEVRQIIRKGAFDLGQVGRDNTFGYGRIDATNTLNLSDSAPLTPYITAPLGRSSSLIDQVISVYGGVLGANFASFKLEYGFGRLPTSWSTVTTSTQQVTGGLLGQINTSTLPEGSYTIRLTATDLSGKAYEFRVFDVTIVNLFVDITNPVNGATVAPKSTVAITASVLSNSAVTKVEFYIAGVLVSTDTTAPYVYNWKVPGKRYACYNIAVKAYNSAGINASKLINVCSF